MGNIYHAKGDIDKALEHHQLALKIDREIGNRVGESNVLGNIGNFYQTNGDTNKSLEHYEQALEISNDIGQNKISHSLRTYIQNLKTK